jgi:hypothetical protein
MTVGNWERYSRHIASFITAVILTQPTLTTAVSHTTISHYQRPFPIVNPQSPLPITPHPANTRHRCLIITLLGIAAVFRLYASTISPHPAWSTTKSPTGSSTAPSSIDLTLWRVILSYVPCPSKLTSNGVRCAILATYFETQTRKANEYHHIG